MGWALEQGVGLELTPPARAVLCLLVHHANADGWAWPSQSRLARLTGYDRRTVQRALADVTAHAAALGLEVLDRRGCASRYRLPAAAARWAS
jgi:pyocin large subunit-like protein